MIIEIHVTQADINQGCAGDSQACPVARAVARAFPAYEWFVFVGPTDMAVGGVDLPLPFEVQRFIAHYDGGIRKRPFSFGLDVPESLMSEVAPEVASHA